MATKQQPTLLSAIEQIVEKAEGTGLSSEFYTKAARPIKYVATKLGLTREQAVMMALFVEQCDDCRIVLRDLARFVECRTTKILNYTPHIDELAKRGFIKCRKRDNEQASYRVPVEVIEAFKADKVFEPKDYSGLSCDELFGVLEYLFDQRRDDELTFEELALAISDLMDSNKQLAFVQKVRNYNLAVDDEVMLLMFSHLCVNNGDENIMHRDIDFVLEQRSWLRHRNQLSRGTHKLLKLKLIEYNNDNGLADRETFHVSREAKRELFPELVLQQENQAKKRKDVIKHEDIKPKKLFYSEQVDQRVGELARLLDEKEYAIIHDRMKGSGFRCAFTCLLYGAPGTGKTETVLQLARQTGRDIVQVNISQIKSCWVGESEKNIKEVFDNYRARVQECERTPILLFNEADAIIGIRREGAQRAVDKMENSIQNIILQEMETLDGILIATTNLAQNMDKAFERRFLYKIRFDKPTIEARMCIWQDMIPGLDEKVCRTLATKYEFSGGQIENIARLYTIGNILHGTPEDVLETLKTYCDNERLEHDNGTGMGFKL